MKSDKKPNRKELAALFNIPYPTISQWTKAKPDDWRREILDFLSALSLEEINAIKARNIKIKI
ncbi:hypothetical protein LMG7974_01668 [Campylobacter majalis]|uniref:Uncharacterized protein n=1 Tax=Campylobacter majalis TaxID=2790656 RepID=A0ABN7KAW9_9BACT|nr:hypothetical protein [Campylobacter majalis]CAD7289591.1 hypothetical protein LMG7974_01668 [Campylobacter majalis]